MPALGLRTTLSRLAWLAFVGHALTLKVSPARFNSENSRRRNGSTVDGRLSTDPYNCWNNFLATTKFLLLVGHSYFLKESMKNSITQKIAVVAAFVTLATSSAFADCTKESIAKAIKTDFKNMLVQCKASAQDDVCYFLNSAADYKAAPVANRAPLAESMEAWYLATGSKLELNITAAMMNKTKAAYEASKASKKYDDNLFADAQLEVMNELVKACANGGAPTKLQAYLKSYK